MAEYTRGRWEITKHPPLANLRIVIKGEKPYLDDAIAMVESSDKMEANAQLIVSAVNSCISLNPENPLAVAEGMDKVVKALKVSITLLELAEKSPHKVKWGEKYDCLTSLDRIVELKQALASIERGK